MRRTKPQIGDVVQYITADDDTFTGVVDWLGADQFAVQPTMPPDYPRTLILYNDANWRKIDG